MKYLTLMFILGLVLSISFFSYVDVIRNNKTEASSTTPLPSVHYLYVISPNFGECLMYSTVKDNVTEQGNFIYWWDTNEHHHAHYLLAGQIIHISDHPLVIRNIVINMDKSNSPQQIQPVNR
jgi:hypothetical protein